MRSIAASCVFGMIALLASTVSRSAHAQSATCANPVTFCEGNSGYYVAPDDRDKVQPQLEPLLKELRACLDAAGGKHVSPVIVIRFDSDAKPVEAKVEAAGYESLPCVAEAQGKLVNARSVRATSMRCEYGCPKPKASPPVPPPVVVAPTPTTPTTQPTQPTQSPPVQPPPPQQPPPKGTHIEKTWYGWQNLVADAASVTILAIGVSTKSTGVEVAGGLGYVFASPTVHWIHGNIGPGFGSLGMRVLLPPIGFVVGLVVGAIAGARDNNNDLDRAGSAIATGAIAGFFIGVGIPVALDAAVLGWEKEEVPNTALAPKAPPSFTMRPLLSIDKTGTGGIGGVGGTF